MDIAEKLKQLVKESGIKDKPSLESGDFIATCYYEIGQLRVSRVGIAEGKHGIMYAKEEKGGLTVLDDDKKPVQCLQSIDLVTEYDKIAAKILEESDYFEKMSKLSTEFTLFDIPFTELNGKPVTALYLQFGEYKGEFMRVHRGFEHRLRNFELSLGLFALLLKSERLYLLDPKGKLLNNEFEIVHQ